MEVPMLEGEEGVKASELYGMAFKKGAGNSIEERFKPLIDYYKEITGEEETNPNAIIPATVAPIASSAVRTAGHSAALRSGSSPPRPWDNASCPNHP